MSYRKVVLATGEFYHIFNKTVGSEGIFNRKSYCNRALDLIEFYRFPQQISYSQFQLLSSDERENRRKLITSVPPLVKIFAFVLMPNHYHFLVQQLCDGGISHFLSNFQNSFARYFNIKNERGGKLFREMFKAVRVESNELLLHISRYIHLNLVTSYIIELDKLDTYRYSSFSTYMGHHRHSFIETDLILESFLQKKEEYRRFVYDQADYQRRLKEIKNLLLE